MERQGWDNVYLGIKSVLILERKGKCYLWINLIYIFATKDLMKVEGSGTVILPTD